MPCHFFWLFLVGTFAPAPPQYFARPRLALLIGCTLATFHPLTSATNSRQQTTTNDNKCNVLGGFSLALTPPPHFVPLNNL